MLQACVTQEACAPAQLSCAPANPMEHSRSFPQKLIPKKFLAPYGIQILITVFTRTRRCVSRTEHGAGGGGLFVRCWVHTALRTVFWHVTPDSLVDRFVRI
jgi:hypothetical protein